MRLFKLMIVIGFILGVISSCGDGSKSETVTASRSSELIKQGDQLFDNEQQPQALDI